MAVTILAVDDSATMRSILEMSFAGEDAKVFTVASAEHALSKINEIHPDLVILDNSLPGMTSYDLCRQLKRSAPQVRALVLASEHHPYDETKGRQAGIDGTVSKPFETQILLERVNELVARRGAEPTATVGASAPQTAPTGQKDPTSASRLRQKTVLGTGPAMPAAPAAHPAQPAFRRPEAMQQSAPAQRPQAAAGPAPRQGDRMSLGTAATQEHPVSYPPMPAITGDLHKRLSAMGLSRDQVDGVLALSREVIEQVVWEVVPELAETLIREELRRLTAK